MSDPSAPMEAVSSQRSEEIKARAGIATPNTRGQFAPKEIKNNEVILRPNFH